MHSLSISARIWYNLTGVTLGKGSPIGIVTNDSPVGETPSGFPFVETSDAVHSVCQEDALGLRQSGALEEHHNSTLACFAVEEAMSFGNLIFRWVSERDAIWYTRVLESKIEYNEAESAEWIEIYPQLARGQQHCSSPSQSLKDRALRCADR